MKNFYKGFAESMMWFGGLCAFQSNKDYLSADLDFDKMSF
jgi:hypothetical protein